MTENSKDHFSSHAACYAALRPTYSIELVNYLASLCGGNYLALDCGCGNGQLSTVLAERFVRVVATDMSESQLKNAKPHARVEYRKALAHESGLADGSVELVTAAQAAHWFDLEKFYGEVHRVGKPNAIIALITYGLFRVDPTIDELIDHFYHHVIGSHWPPERAHVDAGYSTLPFPFPEIRSPSFHIHSTTNRAGLFGLVDTWSAVREAEKVLGRAPMLKFAGELNRIWPDAESIRPISWNVIVRAGKIHGATTASQ